MKEQLARIWEDVLDLDGIGVEDVFPELGWGLIAGQPGYLPSNPRLSGGAGIEQPLRGGHRGRHDCSHCPKPGRADRRCVPC